MALSSISLVPWDPNSPEHVERMRQQRVACGWKVDKISNWQKFQKEGELAFYWITLGSDHEDGDDLVQKHLKDFPAQSEPLTNSCTSLMGCDQVPDASSFHPIGHICLDGCVDNHANNRLMISPEDGTYALAAFYISEALQGSGLGNKVMSLFERTAKEVYKAKTITLDSISNEDTAIGSPRMIALGRPPPKVKIVDWYQRRGYVVYDVVKDGIFDIDSTGKRWNSTLLYMKKNIVMS
ncbi:hypothetical protein E8E14_008619 [Neopestalotiopsis sp. 37M]|nr:hypothetical protein E8E14_008619 [Neopestalotiopsis sp. 37M]